MTHQLAGSTVATTDIFAYSNLEESVNDITYVVCCRPAFIFSAKQPLLSCHHHHYNATSSAVSINPSSIRLINPSLPAPSPSVSPPKQLSWWGSAQLATRRVRNRDPAESTPTFLTFLRRAGRCTARAACAREWTGQEALRPH